MRGAKTDIHLNENATDHYFNVGLRSGSKKKKKKNKEEERCFVRTQKRKLERGCGRAAYCREKRM